jgi:hypothetical protein
VNDDAALGLDQVMHVLDLDSVTLKVPDQSGWVTGPEGERILWIPSEFRSYVQLEPCVLVIGKGRITFDLSDAVHGTDWAKCYEQNTLRGASHYLAVSS